ncbi:cytochrome P450 [Antribacter sp. KLBMP9083]|uniref:Cytochrome P450 n=1 Tax=Antribacter soli TaxID=2910976 RepID=A0AA41QD13_9MICO|nr:cytochrome P450 [Antribacter soli]MCF4120881.1 cytochrome P450 [Antribacter soli]
MLTTTFSERLEDLAAAEPLLLLTDTTRSLDPTGLHRELRARWGTVAPVLMAPDVPAWLVLGHSEVAEVLRAGKLFSRDSRAWSQLDRLDPASGLATRLAPRDSLYYVDGPRHRELRTQVDDALEGLDEHRLAREVRARCEGILDRVRADGHADLVLDYAMAVPLLAMASMFGLSPDQSWAVLRHSRTIHAGTGRDVAEAFAAQAKVVLDHVTARRVAPADDVASRLVHHPTEPTDAEAQATISTMLLIGNEYEVAWIAQTLRMVLSDARYDGHRGGFLSAAEALDEVLWRHPPASNNMPRFATADCVIGERKIARGDAVVTAIHGANQDDDLRADDLWLEVGNRSHMTWGAGAHACPVRRPARLIAQIAVDVVLRRLGGMTLAVDPSELDPVGSIWSSYPASLPVQFTA